jgi:hypothetical protein
MKMQADAQLSVTKALEQPVANVDDSYCRIQGFMDVLLSIILLVVTTPIIFLIIMMTMAEDGWNPFCLQERVGADIILKSLFRDEYIEKYLVEKELNLTVTLDAKEAYNDADFVVIVTPTNYDSKRTFLYT